MPAYPPNITPGEESGHPRLWADDALTVHASVGPLYRQQPYAIFKVARRGLCLFRRPMGS